jgi:hypothetical protein
MCAAKEEDGHRGVEPAQQLLHRLALRRRQSGHRLVEQEEARPAGHGECDHELPLVSVGEIARLLVAKGLQTEIRDQRRRPCHQVGAGRQRAVDHELPPVERRTGQQQVLLDRQVREQTRDLERPRDSERRTLVRRKPGDVD